MLFLLDTNAVSDFVAEHPKIDSRLAQLTSVDRAVICPITRGEILFGIERLPHGRRRVELHSKTMRALASLACEPCTEPVGDEYSRLKRARESHGLPLDENDLRIAATAIVLGATLVMRDTDFRAVAGLRSKIGRSERA